MTDSNPMSFKSFRLNRYHREQVLNKAIADRFNSEKVQQYKAMHDFGMRCYYTILTHEEVKWSESAPSGWLSTTNRLYITIGGYSCYVQLENNVRSPCYKTWSISDMKIREEYLKLVDAENDLKTRRMTAMRTLEGFLKKFTNLQQLIDQWPEGKSFYKNLMVNPDKSKKVNLPAIQTVELNKMFGLPKDNQEEESAEQELELSL